MHSTLDWNDLRVVLAVARAGSLSGAARYLRVTHSTVFRRLAVIAAALSRDRALLEGECPISEAIT